MAPFCKKQLFCGSGSHRYEKQVKMEVQDGSSTAMAMILITA